MKSLVMKSIYAGLGLIGTGSETVAQLGRKLARQADLSEKEGEQLARRLHAQTDKAIGQLTKTLDTEIKIVVDAFHAAKHPQAASRSPPKHKKARVKARAARPGHSRKSLHRKAAR